MLVYHNYAPDKIQKHSNILIDFKYCDQYFSTFLNGISSKTLTSSICFPSLKRINACDTYRRFFCLILIFLSFCWFLIFSFSRILLLLVLYRVEIHGQYDISPDMSFLPSIVLKLNPVFQICLKEFRTIYNIIR